VALRISIGSLLIRRTIDEPTGRPWYLTYIPTGYQGGEDETVRSSQSWEKPSLRRNTQRITLIALFGVAVFVSKTLLPSPIDKMAVVPQAMFLALGSLLSRPLGATLVSVVASALTVLIRPSLAPFTIAFALTYGLLTDGLTLILRVRSPERDLRVYRLVAALTISTIITGLASYYTTVHAPSLASQKPRLGSHHLGVGRDKRTCRRVPGCAHMDERTPTHGIDRSPQEPEANYRRSTYLIKPRFRRRSCSQAA